MPFRPAVIAAALAILALPVLAQSNDVGVWAAVSHVTGSTNADATTHVGFVDKLGYGVSFNHYWTKHFSTEVTADATKSDATLKVGGLKALALGRLKETVITGTLQWHPAAAGKLDPYVGVGGAWVKSDSLKSSDLDLAGIGTVKVGDKGSWVAGAGVNVAITPRLALAFDAKYIPLKPKSSGVGGASLELKLNPLIWAAGVRYRF
ncbi:MAG TPA: OmpW family outer membrane protein [Thermoanaerobaculia bacterium]|nr:OmpW family outer membrane protein [Thermoanaerobaculia bacterium]